MMPLPAFVAYYQDTVQEEPRLAALLSQAAWNPATRGPLLVIGADVAQRKESVPLPLPTRGLYNANTAAAAFGWSLVRFPTLTCVAPDQMPVIPQLRRAEEVWDAYPGDQNWFMVLLGELEPSQLRAAFSPQGLGLNELTSATQRKYWQRMLPDTIELPRPAGLAESVTELPFSQLGAPPLRLRASLAPPKPQSEVPPPEVLPPTVSVRLLPPRGKPEDLLVPYTRKRSDLSFTAPELNVLVPLAGITTVAELVQRLRERVGIDLVADRRLHKLKVQAYGTQARAGDLLAALCRATCTTLRRLDEVYLITDDLPGLGARLTRLQMQTYAMQPLYLGALYRLARQGLEGKPGEESSGKIAVELIVPGYSAVALGSEELPVIPDMHILPPLKLTERLEERGLMVRPPEDPALLARLLRSAQQRHITTLFVPYEESKPFAALLAAAPAAGLGVVPLLCPLQGTIGEEDRNIEGLRLSEALQLPGVPGWERWTGPFGFGRDANMQFRTPESVDVAAFARRAAQVRALPGVRGLGLWQTAAPGYARSDTPLDPLTVGYSISARKAFLREQGIDPIDMGGLSPFFPASAHELQDTWQEACAKRRDTFLLRVDAALKAEKVAGPLSLLSMGPFCVAVEDDSRPLDQWQRWQGKALDPAKKQDETPAKGAAAVPVTGHPAWLHLSWSRSQAEASLSHLLSFEDQLGIFSQWLNRKLPPMQADHPEDIHAWDGVVIDLSDLPPASALRVLESTLAP